jgi:hypothetical protein
VLAVVNALRVALPPRALSDYPVHSLPLGKPRPLA